MFKIDDDYLGTVEPIDMVKMTSIDGIQFKGVKFQDERTGISLPNKSTGISSINSDYIITTFDNSPNPMIFSEFSGLKYGINALGINSVKPIKVESANFFNNFKSAYLNGISDAWITSCNFDLNTPAETLGYGLYLDHCTGYKVEDNTFENNSGDIAGIGMVVNASGTDYNLVYNNRFNDLEFGIIAQNSNRSSNGQTGLEIKCNDFTGNYQDICVTSLLGGQTIGIQAWQGNNGSHTYDPAGNTFSYTGGGFPTDYLNETGNNITYWYHFNQNGHNVKPLFYSKFKVIPNYGWPGLTYSKNLSCPPDLELDGGGSGELMHIISLAQNKADSISELLDMLVDGGNTEQLNNEVNSSYPSEAWEVYQNLIQNSPFLSDTVITSAINKEDVLVPEMLTDVLVANPQAAKSDEILSEIENRMLPLTEEMKDEIMMNWYITGAKESLESRLSGYHAEKVNAFYKLISFYRNDTTVVNTSDSIIALLESDNELYSKYRLVNEYIEKGGYSEASTLLASIPALYNLSETETDVYNDYVSFLNILTDLKQENKQVYEADSSQLVVLFDLANCDFGIPGAWSRSILLALDSFEYTEPVILPTSLKSSPVIAIPDFNSTEEDNLNVYPNPANKFMIAKFSLKKYNTEEELILYSPEGKIISKYKIDSQKNYLVIPAEHLKSGTYYLRLMQNGSEKDFQKISIIN